MNLQVRAAAGVNGTVVILSAWCRECGEQSMPDRHGACMFCESLIVDESRLSARQMLDQISGREPSAVLRAVAEPGCEAPSRPGNLGRPVSWTCERSVAAIRVFADGWGRPPFMSECVTANGLPSTTTLTRAFGSFRAAIVAAGFPRPVHGRPKASGGVDVRRFPAAPPPEELLDALRVA